MPQVTIGRWGNSLAVRIPGELAAQIGLRDGASVEIDGTDGGLVIRPAVPRVTVEAMFAGKPAAEWRALYEAAYDWGPDVGREIVPE
jgi:antitoxin MazE